MHTAKALFLDRDGIINVDHGYVSRVEEFEFTEDIFALLKLFQKKEYLFFIVTNQSGIGRGYYTQESYRTLTEWMLKAFQDQGIKIEGVYHCPHAPQERCHCRKPEIGMIMGINHAYDIDMSASWMIGDKQSDIDFAHNAQIGHTIAIGGRPIQNADYFFDTISECKRYLEENQDIINI